MLVSLENTTQMFAERIIFMNVNLQVHANDRIGLVGANGSGKSTLLQIIHGDLIPGEGMRTIKSNLLIGLLKQDGGLSGGNTLEQEMLDSFRPILQAQQQMKQIALQIETYTEHHSEAYQRLSEEYARLQSYFENNGGYNIMGKIKSVLDGIGLGHKDLRSFCSELSGGERTRLALAKLLCLSPDLLMLDEPTNHLDFAALAWLEEYLQSYKGALIVVSHDRYFLDKVCNKMWGISGLRVMAYNGNYTRYVHTRNLIYERQLKEYEMQQKNVAKLTDYIARNKARASTAAMAHSREKELQRMSVVKQPPKPLYSVRLAFHYEHEPIREVLYVEDLSLQVGEESAKKTICENIAFHLQRGDKVALVGRSGVGKTTLLRTLLGLEQPGKGIVRWGKNVKTSYYEQDQINLSSEKTVLNELWDRFPDTYEQDVRNVLGNLQFSGDAVYKQVKMLSGGEMARLKFAIMMYEEGNVLLLDEPTNHLDLPTREVLDRALMDYNGTILAISHDRYLLSRMPMKILELFPNGIAAYEGGYETYLLKRQEYKETIPKKDQKEPKDAEGYYRSKRSRAQDVLRRKQLLELEQEISDIELKIAMQQNQLYEPQISSDYQKVTEICASLERMRIQLNSLVEKWTEFSE
jgi:ATP-binding cassette subfamily F protein 3